jgi:hypothetical protein
MLRKSLPLAIATLFVLSPARLMAGGPPWLCLPIDGITLDNVGECTDMLTKKLEDRIWPYAGQQPGLQIVSHANQWYLTFYMGKDVALGDVEKALAGSRFSIPRDKLRLFGHVILEIDSGRSAAQRLLADFEKLDCVSVAESKEDKHLVLATVDMPYPIERGRPDRGPEGWDSFSWNQFNSNKSTPSQPHVTAGMLPSYDTFRDIAARHEASLKEIRWSTRYACRPLGGVAVPGLDAKPSKQLTQTTN